jgi:hypothetical protein
MIIAAYTMAVAVLDKLGVFRAVEIRLTNAVATEHGTIMTLLIIGIAVGVAGLLPLAFLGYRVYRLSERAEALTAATYLEAKRALEQHR